MTKDTYSYTYRVGRKVLYQGIPNAPYCRKREHQRVSPGGKMTVDDRAKASARARQVNQRQTRTWGYYG